MLAQAIVGTCRTRPVKATMLAGLAAFALETIAPNLPMQANAFSATQLAVTLEATMHAKVGTSTDLALITTLSMRANVFRFHIQRGQHQKHSHCLFLF